LRDIIVKAPMEGIATNNRGGLYNKKGKKRRREKKVGKRAIGGKKQLGTGFGLIVR